CVRGGRAGAVTERRGSGAAEELRREAGEGAGGAAAVDGVFGVEELVEGGHGSRHGGLELLLKAKIPGEALGVDEVLVGGVFEEAGERAEVEAFDGAGGVEQVG